ncbi:MAG TPA: sulfotransferase [Woeseiaceae bacterium]|nr:sulfotransferase [Woeseiaceae bacterium]
MTIQADIRQAVSAIKQQRFDEATELLSQVLKRHPGNLDARWLQIRTLERLDDYAGALDQLRQLLIHVKKNLPAIDQVADHMRQKRYPLGHLLKAYESYLAIQHGSANARFNYAYNLAKDGQFAAAIRQYEQTLKLGVDAPEEVHLNIANIYMDHLQAADKAKSHLESALELNPEYTSAYYNLGNLYEQQGRREEARQNFECCLQHDAGNEAALARLADTQVFTRRDDPLLARLIAAAENGTSIDIQFALGKAYEQLGDFDAAWAHFSKGNKLDGQSAPAYHPKIVESRFERIMSAGHCSPPERVDDPDNAPVFICGMFRSGSTLLEQILASHPRFVAGGESEFFPRLVAREFPAFPSGLESIEPEKLRAWRQQHEDHIRELFGEGTRPTDKRPDNFLYIGLIKAVLPTARFVVTERDWRDIATSVYSVRLGPGQAYATTLVDIRHYIGLQAGLIDHWESLLGNDLKRIHYEDLVQQPRQIVPELLEWLGEDWDERCLAFHELRNSVRTASVWQVREPLHANSVGRWKNYRQQFIEAFGPDLGD